MKRIGILSDTHGNWDAMKACIAAAGAIDAWFHLGDFSIDAEQLIKLTGKPVHAIAGNCDNFTKFPTELIIELEGMKLLLMHGHKYGVYAGDTYRACLRAEELGCNALFYGHTHISEITNNGGLIIINPGSPSEPRCGKKPSFAIAELNDGILRAKIITL